MTEREWQVYSASAGRTTRQLTWSSVDQSPRQDLLTLQIGFWNCISTHWTKKQDCEALCIHHSKVKTFHECAIVVIANNSRELKHVAQWKSKLQTYA